LTFGKEFTEAVEMKQVAQQEAERARFLVEKVGRNTCQCSKDCADLPALCTGLLSLLHSRY